MYIVIGGTSGIGKEIVMSLISTEKVIVFSRSKSESERQDLEHFQVDVTEQNPTFPEISGPIQGLVYCPGSIRLKPFRSIKPADFEQDFNLNFLGAVKAIQKYLPNLLQAEKPSILLFSSVAAQLGMPYHSSISASKSAIEGFARAFASEFAPKIRINVVAPSLTDTPMAAILLNSEIKAKAAAERHPLKRVGSAKEIAAMACFLLKSEADFITGQVFTLDGGLSLKL